MTELSEQDIHSLITGTNDNIFAFLGPHRSVKGTWVIRTFCPSATCVDVIDKKTGKRLSSMTMLHGDGLFEVELKSKKQPSYYLKASYDSGEHEFEDPYRFSSSLSQDDLYLYCEGTHEKAYQFLGAHPVELDGTAGVRFVVWAPNAQRVSVVGEFNIWDGRRHVMRKHGGSGCWEIFIPDISKGAQYKYEIRSRNGDLLPHKADPFGFYAQCPPEQASVVEGLNAYDWGDHNWQKEKGKFTKFNSAASIYELHLGSWKRRHEDGNRYLTYKELAEEIVEYVRYMNFTHIQLMPVSEYPFDGSWGYQPVGLFAPTSRFGSPSEFKYFIDLCHQNSIAVLIDWVPGHFPTDGHGLGKFDGTSLYEHEDERQGFHPDWNTYIYNYGRSEVANLLMSNAIFWLDEFHIDGLRVDAVASMLYLDYSRENGQWIANQHGGRENLEAIAFLRDVNERVYKNFPDAMMIAEESTAWPGVSQPVEMGGLGFGFKWNMGWMNDSLEYIGKESIHRQHHHHDLTFSLYYAFSENFILPLSHDEVVHGKGSILARMPGDAWQKFANMRAYYSFMWCHPGKKLLFMGCEFAQGPEWNHSESLCWHQVETPEHKGIQTLVKDLNQVYISHSCLYDSDHTAEGFEWIEANDRDNSTISFIRRSVSTGESLIVVCNMTPVVRHEHLVGIPESGEYDEIFNSDAHIYGGTNCGNSGAVVSTGKPWHYKTDSLSITLPPLATVIFKKRQ